MPSAGALPLHPIAVRSTKRQRAPAHACIWLASRAKTLRLKPHCLAQLDLGENKPEAQAAAPKARRAAVTVSGTHEPCNAAPRATAQHAVSATSRTFRIASRRRGVVITCIPILTPFPYIAVHVIKTIAIRGKTPDRRGILKLVTTRIIVTVGISFADSIAPKIRTICSTTSGIFPFRFRRQTIRLVRLDFAIQPFEVFLGVIPTYALMLRSPKHL
jgi:hypothetical protein